MMRTSLGLKGLRSHMKSKGLDPAVCLMGGFMEDEEHGEYGLIVTPDRQLIWYERNTLSNKLHKWEHHSDAAALTSMFAEAEVAYDMMRAASPASAGGSSSPTTKGRSKAPSKGLAGREPTKSAGAKKAKRASDRG